MSKIPGEENHKVLSMIRKFSVYEKMTTNEIGVEPTIKKLVEERFKQICSCGDDTNFELGKKEEKKDMSMHNLRLNKKNLKKYLQKKYNSKLSTKICYLFDWSNHHNYKTFY